LMEQEPGFFGSGAVLLKLRSGEVIVGVHLPLDRTGKFNGKVMEELVDLLSVFPVAYAIGDMNFIPGAIEDTQLNVLRNSEYKVARDWCSFLPSFFDTIPDDEGLKEILTVL